MLLTQTEKLHKPKDAMNGEINVLLSKLDIAIEDMEQGRVQTIDEAWKEIDAI